jgi:hypothetical protein
VDGEAPALAHVYLIAIHCHYLLFGEPLLKQDRHVSFSQFALGRFFGLEVEVLDELLLMELPSFHSPACGRGQVHGHASPVDADMIRGSGPQCDNCIDEVLRKV